MAEVLVERKDLLVTFILDESGSMESCKDATIKGFNEYISKLQEEKNRNTFLTLTRFNSSKVDVYLKEYNIANSECILKDYNPDHSTPLYDAIGRSIKDAETKDRDVICIIMTDGYENDSKEFTKDAIKNLIKEKENEGWLFVFLGANIDTYAVGNTFGIHAGNVSNYTYDTVSEVYSCLAENCKGYSGFSGISGYRGYSGISDYSFFTSENKSKIEGGIK